MDTHSCCAICWEPFHVVAKFRLPTNTGKRTGLRCIRPKCKSGLVCCPCIMAMFPLRCPVCSQDWSDGAALGIPRVLYQIKADDHEAFTQMKNDVDSLQHANQLLHEELHRLSAYCNSQSALLLGMQIMRGFPPSPPSPSLQPPPPPPPPPPPQQQQPPQPPPEDDNPIHILRSFLTSRW